MNRSLRELPQRLLCYVFSKDLAPKHLVDYRVAAINHIHWIFLRIIMMVPEYSSSSAAFRFANLTTVSGKWASSATWIPKLWSQTPSSTLYSNVISLLSPSLMWTATFRFLTCGTVCDNVVSSWKCVANKQKARICVAMCLWGIVRSRNAYNIGTDYILRNCPC